MLFLNARRMISLAAGLALAVLTSCAPVSLKTIPEPPPTAKLRVYVQAFTAPGKWHWGTPHDVFVATQIRRVEGYLERTGIYEVVNQEDLQAVIGDSMLTSAEMEQDDWKLGRAIGRALHADYVMVIERSKERNAAGAVDWYFTSTLINTGSGKNYRGRVSVPRVTKSDTRQQVELIKNTYREIFSSAKDEMLAVALTKGREVSAPASAGSVKSPEAPPAPPQRPGAAEPSVKPAASPPTLARESQRAPMPSPPVPSPLPVPVQKDEYEGEEGTQDQAELPAGKEDADTSLVDKSTAKSGVIKLVVYDFDAPEQYRPAALILTEALREELFRLKRFILVNRETLQKVLAEIALQQTGLIDEKEAVKTGRGLAANQVVTGRFGTLGKVFLFQAKRTDVETFATLGVTSAKFTQGQEEEMLDKLPGLARSLAGQE